MENEWCASNTTFDPPGVADCRDKLESAWQKHSLSSSSSSFDWWQRIWSLHTEPSRHYHTVMHLYEMLLYLESTIRQEEQQDLLDRTTSNEQREQELQAIVLAIFFHDAIYDPTSSQNEADSAKLFQEYCSTFDCNNNNNNKQLENAVVQLILATASHEMPIVQEDDDNNPFVSQKSMALFLDLDMAVLGKTTDAYLHYASLIRKEYHFVARDTYCTKRAEILQAFSLQQRIFHSDTFYRTLEERARDNLQIEINLLRQNKIPGCGDS